MAQEMMVVHLRFSSPADSTAADRGGIAGGILERSVKFFNRWHSEDASSYGPS